MRCDRTNLQAPSGVETRRTHIRTFNVPTNDNGGNVDISISELTGSDLTDDDLCSSGSSSILACMLYKLSVNPSLFKSGNAIPGSMWSKPTVPELGAGTGLLGIAAAVLRRTHVVLTDLPSIIPGLAVKISLNRTQMHQAWRPGTTRGAGLATAEESHHA